MKTAKLSTIKVYEKNAKKHTKDQIEKVAASIKEFGFNQPIVIDKDGVIIVGHGRYAAATLLGYEEVPVIVASELTPQQVAAYRIADNKLNESPWDMDLLTEELQGLEEMNYDIGLTGFNRDLVLISNEKDDAIPDVPIEPRSRIGDIYELGRHKVLCGDATDIEAVLALVGDVRADMYLTDPPYNVNYEGKTKDALKIDNDSMEDGAFRTFLTDSFKSANAVMKSGASFYIWHADSEGYNFRGACRDVNWKVRQCLIWNKNSMVMGRQDYHWKHEPCLYGWKDGSAHFWASDRTQTTVLNFDRPSRSTSHPTMKPVDLITYLITNNSKGGDVIFDNFLGSGSTLIASEKTGRVCIGVELDPKYVDVIVSRYVEYTGIDQITFNGKVITWQKKIQN